MGSKSQSATFSANILSVAAAINLSNVTYSDGTPVFPTTSGTTAQTHPTWSDGFATKDVVGEVMDLTLGKAQLSTVSFGTVTSALLYDVIIGKRWPLKDVTSSGKTQRVFSWCMPQIYGIVRAWADGAPALATIDDTITVTLNVYGAITAVPLKFNRKTVGVPKYQGGPPSIQFHFLANGVLSSGAGIFASSVVDPPEGTFAMVNAGGPALSNNALMYHTQVMCPITAGGTLRFRHWFRFSQAA